MHAWQVDADGLSAEVPVPHGMQEDNPSVPVYLPSAHDLQVEASVLSDANPFGHFLQIAFASVFCFDTHQQHIVSKLLLYLCTAYQSYMFYMLQRVGRFGVDMFLIHKFHNHYHDFDIFSLPDNIYIHTMLKLLDFDSVQLGIRSMLSMEKQ